jgi:hypothetical protein
MGTPKAGAGLMIQGAARRPPCSGDAGPNRAGLMSPTRLSTERATIAIASET